MVIYNIQSNGQSNQLVIELINDAVYIDTNSVAYIVGKIDIDANSGGFGGKLKSRFIGTKHFKPRLRGTGKVYLRATLGTYHKFSLKDQEEIIINSDCFVACRDTITLSPHVNVSLTRFLTGLPMVNTYVKGAGTVMVLLPGPVVEQVLKDEKFVAFEDDIAGYTKDLKVSREFAAKGWLPIAHKMVSIFRGTGTVFFAPNPNKGAKRSRK